MRLNKKSRLIVLGLAIIIVMFTAAFISTQSLSPFGLTLYAMDEYGNKIPLIPLSWVGTAGTRITSVGVDYSFTVTGDVDKIVIRFIIQNDEGQIQGQGWYDIAASELTAGYSGSGVAQGVTSGTVLWDLSSTFTAYTDGQYHNFRVKGTLTAFYQDKELNTLTAYSGVFSIKYVQGTISDFTIIPR